MSNIDSELRAEAIDNAVEAIDNAVEVFRHADGSATVIVYDDDASHANPREDGGNVATLINRNSRTIDIDECEVYGLTDARERWGRRTDLVERYVAMFHPDVALYVDYWTAGDSFGWGYVTTAALETAGLNAERAQEAFDAEVDVYGQWANGEVYGAHHLTIGDPVVSYGDQGAYVSDYRVEDESVWGFLGYDNLADIAREMTDSPIV